ncbi:hypothetical protein P4238_06825 [Pseudomonas aeruginosa]|nr:hypothetical protein [Pseudomonas aeruginosa]
MASGSIPILTPAAGQRAALTLGDGVTLDARGLWSNQVQGGVDADRARISTAGGFPA